MELETHKKKDFVDDVSNDKQEKYIQLDDTTSTDDAEESPKKQTLLDTLKNKCSCCKKGPEDDENKYSNRQKVILGLMLTLSFLASSIYTVIIPFFPRVAAAKGVSTTNIGGIFAIYQFVKFLTSPGLGDLLLTVPVNRMYLFGIILTSMTTLTFGTLGFIGNVYGFIFMCYVIRSLEALGTSAFRVSAFTILASEFPEHIGQVVSYWEMTAGVSAMFSPLIGAALFEAGGFMLPFALIGILMLAFMIMNLFLLPNNDHVVTEKTSFIEMLKYSDILWSCMHILSASIAADFYLPTLPTYLQTYGISPVMMGIGIACIAVVYSISAPIWGYLIDKSHIKGVLIFGSMGSGVINTIIGFWIIYIALYHWILLLIGGIIVAFTWSANTITQFPNLLKTSISNDFPNDYRTFAKVSGLYNSLWAFGSGVGPLVGGAITEFASFPWSMLNLGIFLIITTFLSLLYLTTNIKVREWWQSRTLKKLEDTEKSPLKVTQQ